MACIDFVVPVGAYQHHVLDIRPGQQILHQIERRGIEPLQIVKEKGQRMFRPREYADESTEHQLKAALRVLWGEFRDRRLFSYEELQFWNPIHNELAGRTQRVSKPVAPFAQLRRAPGQKRTDKALKGLGQGGIRDIALVLVELA